MTTQEIKTYIEEQRIKVVEEEYIENLVDELERILKQINGENI